MRIYVTKLSYSAFSIFSNVRKVNLVYPIHNGSCHNQQMINTTAKSKILHVCLVINSRTDALLPVGFLKV
jgi:hypothetical protein